MISIDRLRTTAFVFKINWTGMAMATKEGINGILKLLRITLSIGIGDLIGLYAMVIYSYIAVKAIT